MKSDNVIIKFSKIHGKGVFAARDFKKGEKVTCWDASKTLTKEEYNKLSPKEKDYIPIVKGRYIIAQSPEKYVNHSCNPNTKIIDFSEVATRGIKKGEEITTDYSSDPPETEMICNCGSENCKGKLN